MALVSSALTSEIASIASSASFSVQSDWEVVLREYTSAASSGGSGAVSRLAKESTQFWISAARFGEEKSQLEAIAHLEPQPSKAAGAGAGDAKESTAAAGSSASASSSAAAAAAAVPSVASSSLAAAARSVHLRVSGEGAAAAAGELDLQFRTPLQLLAHSNSLQLTQLLHAPRASYTDLHPKGDIFSVDINAQATSGLSGGANGSLRVWDASSATLKQDLVGHHGDVLLARWFPSGSVALSAGMDLALKIWAVEPVAAVAAQLVGHTRPVTQIRFMGRGRNIVTTAEDGTAKLWDVSRQSAVCTYPAHRDAFPPKFNDALLLDPQAHTLNFHEVGGAVSSEVSDLHGHLLLTGGSDGIVRGFDLRTSLQVLMIPTGGRAGGVESLCAGPKPGSFVLGTTEGAVAVVDLRTHSPLHLMRQDDAAITNIRPWSEDSFWTTSSTGSCNLWRLSSSSPPAIVAQLTGVDCEPIHDVCFSAHFAYLASHNTVRSYAISGIASNHQDTSNFHALQLPQRTTSEGQPAAAAAATAK